ncbi:hypothetical protein BDV12DRAFT_179166 [Aspergillus spectabilis]
MGNNIITTCTVIEWVDKMQESLNRHPRKYRPTFPLLEELSNASANLNSAVLSQPHCIAVQIMVIHFLLTIRVSFKAVVGHSSGEVAAAYATGFFSATDVISIAYLRGTVTSQVSSTNQQSGVMMADG